MSSDRTVMAETSDDPIAYGTILLGIVAATIAACVAAAITYFLADGAGSMPNSVTIEKMGGETAPIGLTDVITSTVFGWVIGGIVLLILRAFTRRPLGIFWIVAIVATVLSLGMPFTIDGAPGDMRVALIAMHVVAAAVGCGVLAWVAANARPATR